MVQWLRMHAQYRGHRFNPWPGKMPYACTPLKPLYLEPELPNKRGHHSEKPALHDWRKPMSSNKQSAQPKKKKKPIKLRLAHPCSQQYYSQQPKWSTCVEATAYQWINTMRHLHAIQYYSALKRNAILTCAISLMNFEITMLSEVSQTQKDK